MSTEDFLNRLGVNTHLNGLTRNDPWNTNASQVASQLRYIGVRIDRDWAWGATDGITWKKVQDEWPLGRFWTSIDEASPAEQRSHLANEERLFTGYPGLIYAIGGPNEEDDSYPQERGATLPDSALVQQSLYRWAHSGGRSIPVSQMEFGAGWTAANRWQGDYNPTDTGIHQNYAPGPADYVAAHTYLSSPRQRPVDVLKQIRALANLATPGKPVAHTEVGAYHGAKLTPEVYGQYMVMGAFDSAAAGDVGYLVYGLQDSRPEQTYGFFTYPGGTANPAAEDYHSLTTVLRSARGSYGPGLPATFSPGTLNPTYSNNTTGNLLLQKPTGDFVIADWSEQVMDGTQREVSDRISFGKAFKTVEVYDVETGSKPISSLHNASSFVLRLKPGDTYLVELSGGR